MSVWVYAPSLALSQGMQKIVHLVIHTYKRLMDVLVMEMRKCDNNNHVYRNYYSGRNKYILINWTDLCCLHFL